MFQNVTAFLTKSQRDRGKILFFMRFIFLPVLVIGTPGNCAAERRPRDSGGKGGGGDGEWDPKGGRRESSRGKTRARLPDRPLFSSQVSEGTLCIWGKNEEAPNLVWLLRSPPFLLEGVFLHSWQLFSSRRRERGEKETEAPSFETASPSSSAAAGAGAPSSIPAREPSLACMGSAAESFHLKQHLRRRRLHQRRKEGRRQETCFLWHSRVVKIVLCVRFLKVEVEEERGW